MTYAERTDALAEQEEAAIEAQDIGLLNACLDEQKDFMLELAQAARDGDEDAATEFDVMRDIRRRNHPKIKALVNTVFTQLERVSA